MATMIPNKVRFGLDLNDLPARAVEIKRESMMELSAGDCANPEPPYGRVDYIRYVCGKDMRYISEVRIHWGSCSRNEASEICNHPRGECAKLGGCDTIYAYPGSW